MKKLFMGFLALMLVSGCTSKPAENPQQPEVNEPSDTVYSADIVIIGAGGAGMAAAIEASDAGANVVILEKMSYAGGNTIRSEGGLNAVETVFQKEKNIEDSVQSMIDDTYIGGKKINNMELVTYFAENSAAAIDWLTSINMDVSDVAQGAGATYPRMHRPADGSKIGGVLVPVLMKNLEERQITILYNTTATELLSENGEVNGVKAVDKNGKELVFNANAVIIATGGFGANEDLYVKYRPDLKGFTTTNHPGATGDGIVMAEAVGADTVDTDQIQTNPTVEVTTNTVISESVRGKGAIFVNQDGKRFISEMLTRDVLSTAILEQPGKYAYMILDQNTMDSMKALQENYEKGIITKGETLADLAGVLEIDADVLESTIAVWNEAVANKNDAEFGRETGLDVDLSQAPYYAIKVSPAVHYTMGGIKINTLTEVINVDGDSIKGLYAAGEVTGGLHGGNRLGGNAVADIMVFGRQAGIQASAYAETKDKKDLVLPETKAAQPTVKGDFKDGTYEASAKGRNGELNVQVIVTDGSISEINVLQHSETAGIFDGVVRDMLPEVIQKQSVQVDTIGGATISSNAVLEAIAAALAQAK